MPAGVPVIIGQTVTSVTAACEAAEILALKRRIAELQTIEILNAATSLCAGERRSDLGSRSTVQHGNTMGTNRRQFIRIVTGVKIARAGVGQTRLVGRMSVWCVGF